MEHHLALSQALAELIDGNQPTQGTTLANEALSVLTQMEKRFTGEPEVHLRSVLGQCLVHWATGQQQSAEDLLDSVRGELEHPEALTPDTTLEFARTLFRLGHPTEAKKLLTTLADLNKDNNDILEAIENLLDEPVGFRQKLEARSLNQNGISAFEQGKLEDAAQSFRKALAVVPDHTALNLNLVQVLLKEYQKSPQNRQLLQECQSCMERVSGIPERHRQYRRYLALQNQLKELVP